MAGFAFSPTNVSAIPKPKAKAMICRMLPDAKALIGFLEIELKKASNMNDTHKIIIHHLYEYRKKHMGELIQKYEKLVKEGLTAKRNNVIYRALKMGSVETLIVSSNYHTNSQFKNILKMLEIAKKTSCKIEFAVSPKIIKKLEIDDSVLAILRYKIK